MSDKAILAADWGGYFLRLPLGGTVRLSAGSRDAALFEARERGYAVQS